jgi:hypothetical protein
MNVKNAVFTGKSVTARPQVVEYFPQSGRVLCLKWYRKSAQVVEVFFKKETSTTLIESTVAKFVTLIAIMALVALSVLAALGRMASKKRGRKLS